jgi:hypothetical protein
MPDLTHLPLFLLASAVRAELYVVGSMYIGLGVTAALADARQI